MTPIFIAALVWTWFLIRDAYIKLKDQPNKFLAYCEGMVGCSKCLGFVATLLLTGGDLVSACAVSIFFSVISYWNS